MPYTEYDYIAHHGIKGMRWGVRRYQNEDGSLTSAGQNRYSGGSRRVARLESRKSRYDTRAGKYDQRQANARTRFSRNFYNWRASMNRYKSRQAEDLINSKTFGDRVSSRFGFRQTANLLQYGAERNRYKSTNARTKLGRAASAARAYNSAAESEVYKTAAAQKGLVKKVGRLMKDNWNRTAETIGGEHVHNGKRALKYTLAQFGNVVLPGSGLIYAGYKEFKGYRTNRK